MLWIYYYEDEKVNKSVDQKEKNCLYRCMSTWITWVFMTSGAYYSLIRRPKRKTSLFFGKIPIASGGYQFQQKQTMPPHTNMIYTRLHFRYVHLLLPVKS